MGLKDALPSEGLIAGSATTEERECMSLNMQAAGSHTECETKRRPGGWAVKTFLTRAREDRGVGSNGGRSCRGTPHYGDMITEPGEQTVF